MDAGESLRVIFSARHLSARACAARLEGEEMCDGFANTVPARESGEGLDFLPIGATGVLQRESRQPQIKRRFRLYGVEIRSGNVTRTPCCMECLVMDAQRQKRLQHRLTSNSRLSL